MRVASPKEPQRGECQSVKFIFHSGEKTFAIAYADGDLFFPDLDLAFADVLDLAGRHDIRAVSAYEFAGRKFQGNGLEGHQREDGPAGQIDLDIVVKPLDIKYFLQVHLYHQIIRFDEDVALL